MKSERRDFIKKAGVGLLSIPLMSSAGFPDPKNDKYQNPSEYYLKEGLVYLNTGSLGPSPKWLVDKTYEIQKVLESNPVIENWGELGKEMEAVRDKAASLLNCDKEEIILTRNTTEGLSMVSSTLNLDKEDEVLTTQHEHGGGEVGLDFAASQKGVKVRKLELPFPAESKDQVIETVLNNISDSTRLLMLSHVSTITGTIMPLEEIAGELNDKEIFLLGDGAQACGMIDVSVSQLGVDAYATSGHKWLMGPKETGLLYLKKSIQESVNPVFTFSGNKSYSASSGTRNVAQFIAFGEMLEWQQKVISSNENNIRELANYCYERLGNISGLQLISPKEPELRSAMISAISVEKPNREIFEYLKSKDIVVKVLPKYNALRFSTHVFNSKEDVDKLVRELNQFL